MNQPETYNQMRKRQQREINIATEQHEIRMRTMRERHYSEMMQVANPAQKPVSEDNHGVL